MLMVCSPHLLLWLRGRAAESAATLININVARQHFEKLDGGSYR